MTPGPDSDDPFRHARGFPGAPVRTFHPRRSVLGVARVDALERLWPRFGFSVHDSAQAPPLVDGLLDAAALFGRVAPIVLEIGSGMGEATAAMAAADPGRDFLAMEAHLPGIAHLLGLLETHGVTNVRIGHGDALEFVADRLAPGSLDAVHVFFPDPWPKARHHKRRIISPERVALLTSRLRVGGVLHCATDWAAYGAEMLTVLTAEPLLVNTSPGFTPRPPHRPMTKFERRGLAAGHDVVDLVFRRVEPDADR